MKRNEECCTAILEVITAMWNRKQQSGTTNIIQATVVTTGLNQNGVSKSCNSLIENEIIYNKRTSAG